MAEEAKKYDLKASTKLVGILYPILIDAHKNYIDGKHRHGVDSDWPAEQRMDIDTPLKTHVARLIANFCRREMPPEELKEELTWIAKLSGWTPQEIADQTGVGYSTVLKYLPDEYKDQEMKRRAEEGAKKQRRKASPTRRATDREKLDEKASPMDRAMAGEEEPFEFGYKTDAEVERDKYIDHLNMWFMSAGDPVLIAFSTYCIETKTDWMTVAKQALQEFLEGKGYPPKEAES